MYLTTQSCWNILILGPNHAYILEFVSVMIRDQSKHGSSKHGLYSVWFRDTNSVLCLASQVFWDMCLWVLESALLILCSCVCIYIQHHLTSVKAFVSVGNTAQKWHTSTLRWTAMLERSFHQQGTVNENVLESDFIPLCDSTTMLKSLLH